MKKIYKPKLSNEKKLSIFLNKLNNGKYKNK